MKPMGSTRTHFWLMLGMAKAVNVNIAEAAAAGKITQDDFAGMVTACRTCSNASGCRRLLDREEHLATTPDYCVNGDIMGKLAV
ncbi:MAG: hypothetical protein KJP02_04710 [Octadecabacter sp.]|nr:hypothetical protein [Octadecabacter sp.]